MRFLREREVWIQNQRGNLIRYVRNIPASGTNSNGGISGTCPSKTSERSDRSHYCLEMLQHAATDGERIEVDLRVGPILAGFVVRCGFQNRLLGVVKYPLDLLGVNGLVRDISYRERLYVAALEVERSELRAQRAVALNRSI